MYAMLAVESTPRRINPNCICFIHNQQQPANDILRELPKENAKAFAFGDVVAHAVIYGDNQTVGLNGIK